MHFVNYRKKLGFSVLIVFSVLLIAGFAVFGTVDSSAHSGAGEHSNDQSAGQNAGGQAESGFFNFLKNKLSITFSENDPDQAFSDLQKIKNAPVFSEFDAWINSYLNGDSKFESDTTARGETLAEKRLALLERLARLDARAAFERALPAELLARLPAQIADRSEKRVAGRGDLLVFAVDERDPQTGQISGGRVERAAVIDGIRYRAEVFGRRLEMTTKRDIPLAGVLIGETLIVDEEPARIIEPADKTVEAEIGSEVTAQVGGETKRFASRAEFDRFVREQIEWEMQIGPERGSSGRGSAEGGLESAWTKGAKTVLVIRVDFSDKPGEPVDHYNQPLTMTRAQNLFANEVNPYYANSSYNKTSLTATVTPVVRVPQTQSFYAQGSNYNQLLTDARNAARSAGFDTNNYSLDIIMFSYTPSIGWAGIAAVGAKGNLLNGAFYLPETAHELGHNYGLLHANLWRTTDGSPIGAGSNVEYGDCYDNMGACVNGNINRHFNARYKRLLDWLTDAEVQTVSSTGTYRVFAQDSATPSGGIRALKINKDASRNYWIEYRQLLGGSAASGALVRWDYASQSYRETQLLDMTPSTSTTADAPLMIGQSFYDAAAQIRLTVVGKGGTTPAESLDIRVEFGAGGGTPTPTPTLTPTPTATPTPSPSPSPTPACSYQLSPASQNFASNGGSGIITVSAPSNCAWTATSYATWISINSAASGSGSGNVSFYVQPNSGSTRTGYISIGSQFFTVNQSTGAVAPSKTAFDFDGDGKADTSVFRPSNGVWYFLNTSSGFTAAQFGISTDKLVPGDYDGDGRFDTGVFRSGTWYLQRSRDGFSAVGFGTAGDIPVSADFNGDGRAEIAVFRPSNGTWYTLDPSNNQFNSVSFGLNGDRPLPADYDGDGKADFAVFRPSNGTWYVLRSSGGSTAVQFGASTDKAVPADYDGDRKTDFAVYRNGIWYILQSSSGFTAVSFGLAADVPVPADYDGDGRADIAVYRSGVWYILNSRDGFAGISFGLSTDSPVQSAYVQ